MYYYVNVTIPYGAGFYGPAPDASVTALLRIKTNSITRDTYPSRDLSYSSRKISLDKRFFEERESEDLYKLYKTPPHRKQEREIFLGPLAIAEPHRLVTTRLSELRRYHRRNHIHLFRPGDATSLPSFKYAFGCIMRGSGTAEERRRGRVPLPLNPPIKT